MWTERFGNLRLSCLAILVQGKFCNLPILGVYARTKTIEIVHLTA